MREKKSKLTPKQIFYMGLGGFAACGVCAGVVAVGEKLNGINTSSNPNPTETPMSPALLATMTPVSELPKTPRPTTTRTPIRPASVISCEHVTNEALDRAPVFEGFPSKAVQVLNPRGDSRFKATWGADLDMMVAEPGALAKRIEKVTEMPAKFNIEPNGGHTLFFLQEGIFEWKWADGTIGKVELPEKQGRTIGFLFRNPFDIVKKSVELKLTCGVANHVQVQYFEKGAFVSQDEMGDKSRSLFTGENRFGQPNDSEGRDELLIVEADWNTKAFAWGTQKGLGLPFEGGKQNWK